MVGNEDSRFDRNVKKYVSTRPSDVTFQRTVIFIIIGIRTSNFIRIKYTQLSIERGRERVGEVVRDTTFGRGRQLYFLMFGFEGSRAVPAPLLV
jgi:hypothetical protein